MKNSRILPILIAAITFSHSAFSWERSFEAGAGYSHDPNHTKYHNSGILISGDFLSLSRTQLAFWSLNAAVGQWYTSAPSNKNLTTGAVSLALRLYPFATENYIPYMLLSAGPAILSSRKYGLNEQGSNFAFQVNGGLGFEYDDTYDFNLRLVHYSNAYTAKPNNGYNILYLFSVGYLF